MSFQGTQFSPEMRKLIVNTKMFFDDFRKKYDLEQQSSFLTAKALGIGEATVKRVMAAFNKSGENGLSNITDAREKPPFALSEGLEPSVRDCKKITCVICLRYDI